MPHSEPLEPGDPRAFGGYRTLGRLGAGGQGVVYLAESPDEPGEPGRPGESQHVVVKTLHGERIRDAKARERLGKEVAAARRVASFCTARVLDADLDAHPPYVVSEYIEGPTLLAQVADDRPLTDARLIRLAVGTATALTAIHQHGIVHRDFKPANIILGPDGPRVIDFGIAREEAADPSSTSGIVGTPMYMAPEHFSSGSVGPPADVFAWASTMVYAATGQGPFTAPTVPAIMHRILTDTPTAGDLPEPLAGLVARCLNKDPDARPTARDILLGLLAADGDVPANGPIYAAASQAAQMDPASDAAEGSPPRPVPPYAPGPAGPPRPPGSGAPLVHYGAAPRKRRTALTVSLIGAAVVVLAAGTTAAVFGRDSGVVQMGDKQPPSSNGGPGSPPPNGQTSGPGDPGKDQTRPDAKKKAEQAGKHRAKNGGKDSSGHTGSGPRTSAEPGSTSTAPPAPRPNRYTPQQVCGSGYRVQESHRLFLRGARVATIYLMYNGDLHCVATLRSDSGAGKVRHSIRASVQRQGGQGITRISGDLWYAGPARVRSGVHCVRYGGAFTDDGTAGWTSPYGHCQ